MAFNLEASKADLEISKKRYAELMVIYNEIKSHAHPKQIFPVIEKQLYDVEQSIQKHTNLIANYEDLVKTMKMMDENENYMLAQMREVCAKYNE